VSIDEAYLDVTERTAWDVAEGFGRHVKQRIQREVGVPASVGVAPDMSTAKLASDHDKPDGLVVVQPDEVQSFLAPIEIDDVHGVGPVRARELREMGIDTAGDLAAADPYKLVERFGERGRELHQRAPGRRQPARRTRGKPKSLSRESSFDGATDIFARVREQARTLGEAVADRATRKDAFYRTIGIKVVTPPYDAHTRAESPARPGRRFRVGGGRHPGPPRRVRRRARPEGRGPRLEPRLLRARAGEPRRLRRRGRWRRRHSGPGSYERDRESDQSDRDGQVSLGDFE